jgi:hypothetical protein
VANDVRIRDTVRNGERIGTRGFNSHCESIVGFAMIARLRLTGDS